jgi:hypothetical protein
MGIVQGIKTAAPSAAAFYNPGVFKNAQLMRDGGLTHLESGAYLIDTQFMVLQRTDNAYPGGIGKD